MKANSKILVTSALPYANGPIHLGHLVEYIQTDIWVRFKKSIGNEVLFLCADDAHGTPIMLKAKEQGITPEELISKIKKAMKKTLKTLILISIIILRQTQIQIESFARKFLYVFKSLAIYFKKQFRSFMIIKKKFFYLIDISKEPAQNAIQRTNMEIHVRIVGPLILLLN